MVVWGLLYKLLSFSSWIGFVNRLASCLLDCWLALFITGVVCVPCLSTVRSGRLYQFCDTIPLYESIGRLSSPRASVRYQLGPDSSAFCGCKLMVRGKLFFTRGPTTFGPELCGTARFRAHIREPSRMAPCAMRAEEE
ncbi:hypothetical protein B0T16DRAFT_231458 [Cercophora newfieldiana]|uniref:Uncharacterized protein n=1 Tax=Cercophora newfieldiana TaxID=92897 RepID=A0AA39XRB9_9PEZI|nr:hypothetical protein B0T16DRAFT_231458 [Cercophora newfieldiana]